MNPLATRRGKINKLRKGYFDVIVIGGGVTGAGIALDASLRGLKVALIEKGDFSSGTSSKSTKLIHGGLRYLKQYEFALVREVGKERAVVHKLATHLVRPEKMLLPLITDGNYGKIITSVGLMVYDVLADVKSEDQRKMLSPKETLEAEPLLDPNLVEGGGLYAEYQTDDFRLVIELIKSAELNGAIAVNYVKSNTFIEKGGRIIGVAVTDLNEDKSFQVYADYVINATGPWVDKVRQNQEEIQGRKLRLTKGVHIVVPYHKLPVKQSVYFDVKDGRMVFAIPKNQVTYIGTTDTDYSGNLDEVSVDQADLTYLLQAVNHSFPKAKLVKKDVESSWAGVRPLISEEGKTASEISRKDEIFVSEKGLISIAGGKLTGFRKMAKRAVDKLLKIRSEHNVDFKDYPCTTKKARLTGNNFKNAKAVVKYKKKLIKKYEQVSNDKIEYLVDLYGNQAEDIIERSLKFNASNGLILAEAEFSLEHEMIMHLSDFFIYRTGRMFFDINSVKEHINDIAAIMAKPLDWSSERIDEEIKSMRFAIHRAKTFK